MLAIFLAGVSAVTSAAIIAAVVVTSHDVRHAPQNMHTTCQKAVYRFVLSVFLALIGFGEGMQVFRAVFGYWQPDGWEAATGAAWGLLAGWLLVVRPARGLKVLCPYAAVCPASTAAKDGWRKPQPGEMPAAAALTVRVR